MSGANLNSVFYAESYHPIQAGSIDGTDVLPHDNGVYRAHLCSSVGLYDPFGDPKVIGDPYRTVFVGRLSHLTNEDTLRKVMSKYGRVKNLRLVRHIVTGASRGYAFVEYEKEREMLRAYKDAHHSIIDDSEVIVDYNRQQLMPGWIPRRLGGGLGGKKESGQLRFGGRERPFRAPLRPIPYDGLKRLGIPPPPEGRYMSRFQVPSPPRRKGNSVDREESSHRRMSVESEGYNGSSLGREGHRHKRSAADQEEPSYRVSLEKEEHYIDRRSPEDRCDSFYLEDPIDRNRRHHKRKSLNSEDLSLKGSHKERDDAHSCKRYKSHRYEKYAGSNSSRHTEYSE